MLTYLPLGTQDEQSKRHERCIDDFAQRWTAVGDFMSTEHSGREEAKLEQMTSLHGSMVKWISIYSKVGTPFDTTWLSDDF